MNIAASGSQLRVLSVDVGGTEIKGAVLDAHGKMISRYLRSKTPSPFSPEVFEKKLKELAEALPVFNRISVGFPGVVRGGKILTAPHFGNEIWAGYAVENSLRKIFGRPARILNDADMHGSAVIEGKGLELVVTLGTGVGTAFFQDGRLMPRLELAHHPIAHGKTYNQYLGDRVLKKIGRQRWNFRVLRALEILRTLINYDKIYIGGGNAAKIDFKLERNMKVVSNRAGTLGGIALWRKQNKNKRREEASK